MPGFELTISVLYAGSRLLIASTPTEHFIGGFDTRAQVELGDHAGYIDFTIAGRHIDLEQVTIDVANLSDDIDRYRICIAADVERWRNQLREVLRHEVNTRRTYWSEFLTIATL